MAQISNIEWTEATWNPITGCTKISDGCRNCYAERLAKRLERMSVKKYKNGFQLTLHPESLEDPLRWMKSKMIFVCSMSDIFHQDVPTDFILKIFKIMNMTTYHTYQILTKRAERLMEIADLLEWTPNIWIGVTVEAEKYQKRISYLKNIESSVRFLSLEPLLSEINHLNLSKIDWVIVGGESGPNARPMKSEWVKSIRDQCILAKVPFFFKQWGGINKKKNGKKLEGRTWLEMPSFSNQPQLNIS